MKKLLLALITMTLLSQAFAGTIENKKTGETIELNLNRAEQEVEIWSSATGVENKTISLHSIKGEHVSSESVFNHFQAFPVVDFTLEEIYNIGNWEYEQRKGATMISLLIPIFNTPSVVAFSADLVVLPLRVTIKAIEGIFSNISDSLKRRKMKKDISTIKKAINSTDTLRVSNKRFERIVNLLK